MLLFALAVVKSDLMRIAMASPATAAHAHMPGMASKVDRPDHNPPTTADRSCAYCDAAAHLPLVALDLPVPVPWTVKWLPARTNPLASPRGPPPFRPTARGPPVPVLIV